MRTEVEDMTEPAEIIIALPGDVILCWNCGAEVAVFVDGHLFGARDPNGPDVDLLPGGSAQGRGSNRIYSCSCGGQAGPRPCQDGVRVLVRSGSWTGWRTLGGE